MNQTQEDVTAMIATLLETAKKTRESFMYSGDEKMIPMALIYGEGVTMMMMDWKDNKSKYQMAAMANLEARKTHAKSLSFVTDSRWVQSAKFCEYFKIDPPQPNGIEAFQRDYHRILAGHGGEIKNFPREIWEEAVVVFTNGPGIPITIQIAPYKEGPNDTIEWLPRNPQGPDTRGKSDLLTDWWA